MRADPETPLPSISAADAERALHHWGIVGSASPLPGERDRNFAISTSGGARFLLKFCADRANRAPLVLQDAALAHLERSPVAALVPRVVASPSGNRIVAHEAAGEQHVLRLTTWLDGETMATWRPRAPALLRDVGAKLGAVTHALRGFSHPNAARELKWDLARASWITEHVRALGEDPVRHLVASIAEDFSQRVVPALRACPRGVVHNDGNDHNVLIVPGPDGDGRVAGIVDFGDVLESHAVCDLAIALAYAMMDAPDPLSAGVHVVAGYHQASPLSEAEVGLLHALVQARLAVSLVNAAMARGTHAADAYSQVSVRSARRLLEQLGVEHDGYATARFREACGYEPCANGPRVASWLRANRGSLHPLADRPLDSAGVYVHDYSVSSADIGTLDVWTDQARFSEHVTSVERGAGATIGVARYDEVRAIYTSDLFRFEGNEGPEWRTVHLGVDVNLPVGTAVHAPLAGTVHSLRDNTTPGDYGPTVVLEHRVDGGALTFWTLYGHLGREVLSRLRPGDAVASGGLIGHIGERAVNGGWWPHVHVQLIADLLGRSGDFTGVARPVERETWLSLSPDPTDLLRAPASARAPRTATVAELSATRTASIGPSLSVSYRAPLAMARGMAQYLIADDGRRYLDCVNNVAHVGHAHPVVVRAGQRKMAVLNTNTRYLYPELSEYARRLTATLPPELSVCFFVCSGSEANELALRLARAYTGARDVIVLSGGYHGNTTTLVDVSPYKFDGPGGAGAPDWVHVARAPDTYRGPHRGPDASERYAGDVGTITQRLAAAGRRPAAFLAESILSCAGQVVLPPGYLAKSYVHVRAAGGVCIADEVQVGLGRVGSHMWAFETQQVVPDIVTMGKPIGNGHPLGAVVTTPAIAAAFANGMEYFNTFGGNPVSCAIGLAVLDVLEAEQLQSRAGRVGHALLNELSALAGVHRLIGDVRGLGLFIGVELVGDRDARTPAARQARYVANRMRELGVLVSTDGPDNNVLKIKPPMCFTEQNAAALVSTLDRVLSESASQPDATGRDGSVIHSLHEPA